MGNVAFSLKKDENTKIIYAFQSYSGSTVE